jgi:hemerythrin-like domain-containing protein
MYRHLLVPLDGSELATNLVTQAVAFAQALGARITFFTMREDYGSTGEGALSRTLSPQAYAEQAAGEANAILAKAVAAAGAVKVECEAVARTGSRPYELILEVATEKACDLIYMASHGRRGLKALLPGSQTQKVLAHTTIPVLVATVESNVATSAGESAIAIIKDEHRAIAAVTNGLRHLASEVRAGVAVDLDFLASMLHYIKAFPDVLHHPKEEQYLFAKLAQRSAEAADLIASLTNEHREGSTLLARLEARVARLRAGGDAQDGIAMADEIDRFVDAQWRHLNAEEKLILPAALRHLTESDWQEIEGAFRANGDLRRGSDYDEAFRRLFTRLMNLTSA